MTDKELKAYEIIKPFIEDLVKYNRTRELRNKPELRKPLALAYYELTGDANTRDKVLGAGCNACLNRALNHLYLLHQRIISESDGSGSDAKDSTKPKRKRGRPRKQDKPTRD